MAFYTVMTPPSTEGGEREAIERVRVIPDGFSWGAFLFTGLWLLGQRLWLATLLFALIWGAIFYVHSRFGFHPSALSLIYWAIALFLGIEGRNLIVRKPATPGREHAPGLVLQGHLDMVCQKNSDVRHDFHHDPITPVLKDGWIQAEGTTLGSDNGIGVAMILALLEASDLPHGPLEALFTVDEEAGMGGAQGLASVEPFAEARAAEHVLGHVAALQPRPAKLLAHVQAHNQRIGAPVQLIGRGGEVGIGLQSE